MSRKFRFDKLVTDRVVENSLAEEHTLDIHYRRLSGRALIRELRRKLIEEAQEIPIDDVANDDVLDEVADAQTVLDEIKRQYNLDEKTVRARQEKRRIKKGDFGEGFYVDHVVLREDSPWIEYVEADPARYPEVGDDDMRVVPGEYEHFKGARYEVLGEGEDTETGERLVVYRPLYPSPVAFWVRPQTMFLESVGIGDETTPRFRRIE